MSGGRSRSAHRKSRNGRLVTGGTWRSRIRRGATSLSMRLRPRRRRPLRRHRLSRPGDGGGHVGPGPTRPSLPCRAEPEPGVPVSQLLGSAASCLSITLEWAGLPVCLPLTSDLFPADFTVSTDAPPPQVPKPRAPALSALLCAPQRRHFRLPPPGEGGSSDYHATRRRRGQGVLPDAAPICLA